MDAFSLAIFTPNPAACEMRVRVFKALAHSSRLLMIQELARGERCVLHPPLIQAFES